MTKFSNVVRYEVKPEYVDDFLKVCSDLPPMGGYYEGLLSQYLIKTGEKNYCGVGLWESEDAMVEAMPKMISFLDTIRHMLEEISPELGVTDAVSGSVVVERWQRTVISPPNPLLSNAYSTSVRFGVKLGRFGVRSATRLH